MQALGARRVAVATYYGDELNQAIVRYFARFAIEALPMGGFSLTEEREALYTTPLMALDDVSLVQVYQYCRRALRRIPGPVDAIYINGGGWDVAPVIDTLEQDLRRPVVWALAAEMWLAYQTLGIRNLVADCGRLVRRISAHPDPGPTSKEDRTDAS